MKTKRGELASSSKGTWRDVSVGSYLQRESACAAIFADSTDLGIRYGVTMEALAAQKKLGRLDAG